MVEEQGDQTLCRGTWQLSLSFRGASESLRAWQERKALSGGGPRVESGRTTFVVRWSVTKGDHRPKTEMRDLSSSRIPAYSLSGPDDFYFILGVVEILRRAAAAGLRGGRELAVVGRSREEKRKKVVHEGQE